MVETMLQFLSDHVAEIVAVCALGLTFYQAYLLRQHNRLTVRPHLVSFARRDKRPGQGVFVYSLLNNGVGPAFIKSFQVLLDGWSVTDLDGALSEVFPELSYSHSITRLGDDYAMVSGEAKEILIFALAVSSREEFNDVERRLNRFDLVVEYESAYGESCNLDTRVTRQDKAVSC